MRGAATLVILLLGVAQAQPHDFSGTYRMQGSERPVILELRQAGEEVEGTLTIDGVGMPITGTVDGIGPFGIIHTDDGDRYFEAERYESGLLLTLAPYDAQGKPDPNRASQFFFERLAAGGQTGIASPATTAGEGGLLHPQATPPPAAAPGGPRPKGGLGGATPAQARQPGTPEPLPPQAAPPLDPVAGELAQVGRRYEGGTRVSAPWAGVAFTIPASYYAGYSPEQHSFLIVSDSHPGLVMIDALSSAPLEGMIAQLSSTMASGGSTLVPQGSPQMQGDTLRAFYTVMTAQGQGILYLTGRTGPAGNVVFAAALGSSHERQRLTTLLDDLLASVQFGPPDTSGAQGWRGRLAGGQLSVGSYSSSNGVNDNAFEDSSTTLDLCSDGSFVYRYSYSFHATVPGVTAANTETDEDWGRWQVEFGLLGPVLALESSQTGELTYVPLLESGGSLFADGRPVTLSASPLCP